MKQSKQLAITGIQRNQPQGTNEACDELINMRFQDGSWRPVGTKSVLYADKPTYKPIVIHKKDNILNWIGYDSVAKTVNHYDPTDLSVIQLIVTFNGTETLNSIQFVKQFLIIVTTENLYRFLWKNETYTRIVLTGIESNFITSFTQDNKVSDIETEKIVIASGDTVSFDHADELLGKYYKLLKEQSDLKRLNGGIFYRASIVLYDGTEILQTLPSYYQFTNHDGSFNWDFLIGTVPSHIYFEFKEFSSAICLQQFIETNAGDFELYKDLVQSIKVYASRIQGLYDISDETITEESMFDWFTNRETSSTRLVKFSEILPVSTDFKEMYDSINWYKIGEIAFNKLEENLPESGVFSGEVTLDLKGFYDNFATRELIDVDNFSHHDLTGNASDIYNDRLELGDIRQTLSGSAASPNSYFIPAVTAKASNPYTPGPGDPAILTYIIESVSKRNCLIQVKLDTSNGIKYVQGIAEVYAYQSSIDANKKAIFLPGLIGYPDYRAIEMVVNIEVFGVYYEIAKFALGKSAFGNFAFRINSDFDATVVDNATLSRIVDKNFVSTFIPYDVTDLTANSIIPITDGINVITDNNRVQVSEVNNPFVFPAKNSQQVSVGIIKAFGTSTEETSQGQFGMFPIYCFTSVGIWGLEIGTGDVYITRVVPINGEVIRDNAAKLDLSFGIAYISAEGLRIIAGKEVIEISEPVEGLQDETLSDNPNLRFFLNHASIVEMLPYIDKVTFLAYLQNAVLGYNKGSDNNELIVMNPGYDYSYVYDIKNKYWFKISGKHSSFIPDYPLLYAVNEDSSGSVVNFSNEIAGTTQCLIITRAHSFDAADVFKKLQRSFLRGFMDVTDDHCAALYIFRSDNLKTWTFETGNDRNVGKFKDIWVTHTFKSARYYAFVFAASLEVNRNSVDNRLSSIACEYELKMEGKLR